MCTAYAKSARIAHTPGGKISVPCVEKGACVPCSAARPRGRVSRIHDFEVVDLSIPAIMYARLQSAMWAVPASLTHKAATSSPLRTCTRTKMPQLLAFVARTQCHTQSTVPSCNTV